MDKLEKYIRDHQPEFDDRIPPDKVWNRINDDLDRDKKQVFLNRHIWKAAAVILMAAVVWLLVDRRDHNTQTVLREIEATEGIAFKQVEEYYFHLIEDKKQEIRQYVINHPEIDSQLLVDIGKLDSSYQELRKKLVTGPDDRIIDAMVVNLQTRIEILNQQLEVLQRIKNLKDKENETRDI